MGIIISECLINHIIFVFNITICQNENSLFLFLWIYDLCHLKRCLDICGTEICSEFINLGKCKLFSLFIIRNIPHTFVMMPFLFWAKAADWEFTVNRQTLDKDLKGISRSLHSSMQLHASTSVDNEYEMELRPWCQLDRFELLIVEDFHIFLRFRWVKSRD